MTHTDTGRRNWLFLPPNWALGAAEWSVATNVVSVAENKPLSPKARLGVCWELVTPRVSPSSQGCVGSRAVERPRFW